MIAVAVRRRVAALGPAIITLAVAAVAFIGIQQANRLREEVAHMKMVVDATSAVLVYLDDIETGQRGYLLTGIDRYLDPFNYGRKALDPALTHLASVAAADTIADTDISDLSRLARRRLDIAAQTVVLRQHGDTAGALAIIRSDLGKQVMDSARAKVAAINVEHEREYSVARASEERIRIIALTVLVVGAIVAAVLGVLSNLQLTEETAKLAMALNERDEALAEAGAANITLEEQAVELETSNAELEQSAEERDHLLKQAEHASSAKSQFLATMSHELRTPLNAILGYIDLLDVGVRGGLTDGQREYLARVRRSGQFLLTLINDVLNFVKLDAGAVEIHLSAVPIDDLLSRIFAYVEPQVSAKRLSYTYEPCDPECRAWADPEKVEQIILNLLSNAVKFTDEEGSITIGAKERYGLVEISVRDTGRGIPESKLASIFEPFVQIERSVTLGSQQGAGLGLAISRELAQRMEGDLTAESLIGSGSTFTLTLPVA